MGGGWSRPRRVGVRASGIVRVRSGAPQSLSVLLCSDPTIPCKGGARSIRAPKPPTLFCQIYEKKGWSCVRCELIRSMVMEQVAIVLGRLPAFCALQGEQGHDGSCDASCQVHQVRKSTVEGRKRTEADRFFP